MTPASLTHGQSVNISVTVAPKSGSGAAPSGIVSLVGGTNAELGIAAFTLTNGTAGGTTNLLPGGTYNVIARYPGSGIYGPSDSSPLPVSVNSENSKTLVNLVTLDINGNPQSFAASSATYGSGYSRLRVDVGDSGASISSSTGISSSCSKHIASCPTGIIALAANGSLGGRELVPEQRGVC